MKTLLVILFLLPGISSFAQQVNLYFFQNPSERTLLFGLPEKDDEWELTNDELTALIKEYWTATTDHQIMPFKEAKALAKDNKEKYAVVTYVTGEVNEMEFTRNPEESHPAGINIEFYCGNSRCYGGYFFTTNTSIGTKAKLIAATTMAQFFYKNSDKFKKDLKVLSESSLLFGAEIKTKTLLVNKEDLKGTEADVLANYPYPVKYADMNTIEKAIIEKSTEFLIIHKGSNEYNGRYVHIILNPSTGAIVSFNNAEKQLSGKDFAAFISNAGLK